MIKRPPFLKYVLLLIFYLVWSVLCLVLCPSRCMLLEMIYGTNADMVWGN